jgi:hypothetical protein
VTITRPAYERLPGDEHHYERDASALIRSVDLSGSGFEDEVHRRFSRPPEPLESGLFKNLPKTSFTGLRAEAEADLL